MNIRTALHVCLQRRASTLPTGFTIMARLHLLPLLLFAALLALTTGCVHAWTPASMSIAGVGDRPAPQARANAQTTTVVVQQANPWVSPYRNVWVTPVHPGWGYPYPAYTGPVYGGPVYHGPAWRGAPYRGYAPSGGCFNCPVHVGRTIHHRSSTIYRR